MFLVSGKNLTRPHPAQAVAEPVYASRTPARGESVAEESLSVLLIYDQPRCITVPCPSD